MFNLQQLKGNSFRTLAWDSC